MSNKRRSVLALSIFMIIAVMLSACTQSLSSAPVATPTLIATGLFVSPIASVENPMEMIEQFAKQTEAAQTAAAGGTPGTPGTPQAVSTTTTGTPGTPVPAVASATPTVAAVTPTNANAAVTQVPATTGPAATAPSLSGNEYILKAGEWPYCIARRYDVDPDAMLKASGLVSPDIYYPGLKLILPQGTHFPGARVLIAHPASYTVSSGDETVYSIACKYGEVDPNAIASTNGMSASAKLTIGQVLQIP